MKKEDIPQNSGIYEQWKVVNYATDNRGSVAPVLSAGWDVTNLANELFHDKIAHELDTIRQRIDAGELSTLVWHMTAAKMTPELLSDYTGIHKRQVKQHLEHAIWSTLDDTTKQKYADLLEITLEQLNTVPQPKQNNE